MLLGADFTAKIADVGLAKLQNKDYLSAQQAVGAHISWDHHVLDWSWTCTGHP